MIEGRTARFNSFNSEFENQLKSQPTYREAYHATEEKFKEKNGFTNYTGWDSFKNVRSRKLRGKKK